MITQIKAYLAEPRGDIQMLRKQRPDSLSGASLPKGNVTEYAGRPTTIPKKNL